MLLLLGGDELLLERIEREAQEAIAQGQQQAKAASHQSPQLAVWFSPDQMLDTMAALAPEPSSGTRAVQPPSDAQEAPEPCSDTQAMLQLQLVDADVTPMHNWPGSRAHTWPVSCCWCC